MRGCCIPSCKSNKRWSKVSFHEMPSNEEVREKWVRVICQQGPKRFPDPYDYVCGKHFTADDYRPACTIRCLKPDAVPSVFTNDLDCREKKSYSMQHKGSAKSLEPSEMAITELNLQGIKHLKKNVRCGRNMSGSSPIKNEAENVEKSKKGQKQTIKSLHQNKKLRATAMKCEISSDDLSRVMLTGQTPVVPGILRKKSGKKQVVNSDVDPVDCAFSVVHYCSPKKESDVLSDEEDCNHFAFERHHKINQRIVLEASKNCATTSDTSHLKTKSSSAFLKKQLHSAQQEISDLHCYITKLKEENVKLQWEKESTLVRHLHDIKQDAVDGNYDAIILLNRTVHYSPLTEPDHL